MSSIEFPNNPVLDATFTDSSGTTWICNNSIASGNSFTSWSKVVEESTNYDFHVEDKTNPHDVTYNQLTGTPTTFPPSNHTHLHSNTTGQTEDDHHNKVHYHNGIDETGQIDYYDLLNRPANLGQTFYHNDLIDLSSDQHHAKEHGHTVIDGSGTIDHADLINVNEDQHHNKVHSHDGYDGSGQIHFDDLLGIPPENATQTYLHNDLTDINADQHHTKYHTHNRVDGSGVVDFNSLINIPAANLPQTYLHNDLQDITSDQHHNKYHTHNGSDGSGLIDYNDLNNLPSISTAYWIANGNDIYNTNSGNISIGSNSNPYNKKVHIAGDVNLDNGYNFYINNIPISTFIDSPFDGTIYGRKDATWVSIGAGAGTISDLTSDVSSTVVTIQNTGGTNAVINAATLSLSGVMTAADKTNLDANSAHLNNTSNPHALTYAQLIDKPTIPGQDFSHNSLIDVSSDQHHNKLHNHNGVDGSGTVNYNDLINLPILDSTLIPTVTTLISDTSLTVGQIINTDGYYSSGDGGAMRYKIVLGGTGIHDGGSYINLNNGLQAEAIWTSDYITLRQFGAHGDYDIDNAIGTNDAPFIEKAIAFVCTEPTSPTSSRLQGITKIEAGSGTFLCSTQVTYEEDNFAEINLSLFGNGIYQTTFVIGGTNTAGFLKVGILNSRDAVFTIRDFTVLAIKSNAGTALELYSTKGGISTQNRLMVNNISINVLDTTNHYYTNGMVFDGINRLKITDVSIASAQQNNNDEFEDSSNLYKMQKGISVVDCYAPFITRVVVWGAVIGIDLSATTDPGAEGVVITESKFVQVIRGIVKHCIGMEPHIIITNTHINYRDVAIDLENVSLAVISNNLIFQENASKLGTGGIPYDIKLRGCRQSDIYSNRFHFAGDNRRQIISIANTATTTSTQFTSKDIYVYDNDFSSSNYAIAVKVEQADDSSMDNYILKSFVNNKIYWENNPTVIKQPIPGYGTFNESIGKASNNRIVKRIQYDNINANLILSEHRGIVIESIEDASFTLLGEDGGAHNLNVGVGTPSNKTKAMHQYDSINNQVKVNLNGKITHTFTQAGDLNFGIKSGGITLLSSNEVPSKLTISNKNNLQINGTPIIDTNKSGTGWYTKFNDGTLIQYGPINPAGANEVITLFPISFLNNDIRVTVTSTHSTVFIAINVSKKTTIGFTTKGMYIKTGGWGGTNGDYIAIGKWK